MNQSLSKILVIGFLGVVAIAFTQCGKPFVQKGDLIYSVDGVMVPVTGASVKTSLAAFEETVYPLTKKNCASCHAAGQQPLHASPKIEDAHNALLSQYKVNFTNPERSRMVLKLRDESHNCWGSCDAAADEMSEAIARWGELMQADDATEVAAPIDLFPLKTQTSPTIVEARQTETAGVTRYIVEAAAALLTAPMVRETATQTFVTTPNDGTNVTHANNSTTAGIASFTFFAPQAAMNGALWALVSATEPDDESFFVRLNTGTIIDWRIPDTGGLFRWVRITNGANRAPVSFNVTAGTNTITLRERRDGARLAKFLWVSSQDYVPMDQGTAKSALLSFSLNSLVQTNPSEVATASEVSRFQSTLYPVTRQYCVSCHGDGQRPRHADPNLDVALEAITDFSLVDFATPANSRIVTKLNTNHNCGTNCATIRGAMTTAIQNWASSRSTPSAESYQIEVRIEDYDAFTYRLSSLKVKTGGRALYLKGVRVLINGEYNPQHANYAYIDELVPANSAAGVTLTPSDMIIFKDLGEARDRFTLAFDVIELR